MLLILFTFQATRLFGQQQVIIEMSPKTLQLNETFSIKVLIKNADKWEVKNMPEIEGMTKINSSLSHSIVVENNQRIMVHKFSQNYTANLIGAFKIPIFYLKVNGEEIKSEDFSGAIGGSKSTKIEDINSKEEAILVLSTQKSDIFVGEGIKLSMGLYVAKTNAVEMEFPDNLEAQLNEIAKKIKPIDCLEERSNLLKIEVEPKMLQGKSYDYYKIFEVTYYPLNTKTIVFKPVTLQMLQIKNKQSKNILFTTKPITIIPKHCQSIY